MYIIIYIELVAQPLAVYLAVPVRLATRSHAAVTAFSGRLSPTSRRPPPTATSWSSPNRCDAHSCSSLLYNPTAVRSLLGQNTEKAYLSVVREFTHTHNAIVLVLVDGRQASSGRGDEKEGRRRRSEGESQNRRAAGPYRARVRR